MKMFPPLLCLFLLFGLLLRFPLGVFPLPLLALIESQNVRQNATGNGLDLMLWYGGVID